MPAGMGALAGALAESRSRGGSSAGDTVGNATDYDTDNYEYAGQNDEWVGSVQTLSSVFRSRLLTSL